MDLEKLKNISDYSIALMEEILWDIKKLSQYSRASIWSNLDKINKKIDLAREHGVNVDILDKQVLDFRFILFKRDVDNKIEEVHTHLNNFSFDLAKIEKEYNDLKKEKDIDYSELDKKMNNAYNEVIRAKIKFMINDIWESDWTSVYSIDQVTGELEIAKKKWLKVDDIEEMLFG